MKRDRQSVLITGGCGSIGAALAEEMLHRDFAVEVLDIVEPHRLHASLDNPELVVTIGDVTDAPLLRDRVSKCDIVVHLAAVVGVDEYLSRPEDVLDVNILGTRNLLHACLERNRPVVLASTSEIYGCTDGTLSEQSRRTLGSAGCARWSYAISKLAAEEYAMALRRRGLRHLVMRYFNVYGPSLDAPGSGRVISKFLGCIRDGSPLTLVDGGAAIRSFCFMDDAVEATALLSEELQRSDRLSGRVFNIGRPEPVTMAELANRMIRLSGHTAGVVSATGEEFFGAGFEEIPHRVPDVSAIHEALGFEASTPLDVGLRRTLDAFGLLAVSPSEEPPQDRPTGEASEALVPWVRPFFAADDALVTDLRRILRSGCVTNNGDQVLQLERELAEHLGVDDVVAVSSGGMALLLALQAAGVTSGKVVLPSFTFIATLNAVVHCGLEPVFCDIHPATWTLCPDHLQRLLSSDGAIRLALPVNVFGVPPDLQQIATIAGSAGVALLLDNAHGMGTESRGNRCAPEPQAQAFSFHATKTLPAAEGGAVVSSDRRLLAETRRLRNHGLAADLMESLPGWNAKMSELHGALGRASLREFDRSMDRRRAYFDRLRAFVTERCSERFSVQHVPEGVRSSAQNLGLLCRLDAAAGIDHVQRMLESRGVQARRYFWPPLHELRSIDARVELPVTDSVARSILCLPLHSHMDEVVIKRIEGALLFTAQNLAGGK